MSDNVKEYIEREAALTAQNKSMNLSEMRERLKRIPAADVRPRWIPVGERLPETGVDVLVKFPQNMAVASIDIGEWVVNSGDGWCTDINLAGGEKNPTHWMPLPKGPEDE